jgi:NodT family efflux transporter outer membrane factor (OMF) lipoprotein
MLMLLQKRSGFTGRQPQTPSRLGPRMGVLCMVAVTAFSCAINPPPSREEIFQQGGTLEALPLDQAWKAAATSSEPIQDNWLATFDDAELNALVEEALANNPDLRVAATRVEQAAQYVEMAKAALRPAINLFGTGGINTGGGDISSALQGLSLGVSWEPDLWGRMRYARSAAESTYASTQADFEFSRQSLAAAVARGWFTATEARLQFQLAEEMVGSAAALLDLADRRWQVGAGSEQDMLLARSNMLTYRDAARQVKLAYDQSLRALELLLGRYPAAELATRETLDTLPGPVPAGLPLEMLERRPDMVAAEQRVAAAFNRVGEAKAARLPRIILNANVASLQSDILELQEDYDNPSAGAGAKLLAPVYQGGALVTQVEIRTLEQKEAVADYARMAFRALGDVENTLAASESLADRRDLLEQSLADNQRALELADTRFRVGRADQREVEQQRLSVQASRQLLLRVQSEQLSERTKLHLALGGSFQDAAELAELPEDEEVADTGTTPTGEILAKEELAAEDLSASD